MASAKVRKGKRKWYAVHAPKLFNEQIIGESFLYDPQELEGRHMTVNVMHLTGNTKKQNLQVFFRVAEVKEGAARTKPLGIELVQSSSRRLVRKGRSKVADSFLSKTKNDNLIRIKPIIITKNKIDYSVQRALRLKARELLREITKKASLGALVQEIIDGKLQRAIKDELNAIAPVRTVELRYLKFEKASADEEEDVLVVEEDTSMGSLKAELLLETDEN